LHLMSSCHPQHEASNVIISGHWIKDKYLPASAQINTPVVGAFHPSYSQVSLFIFSLETNQFKI
ncbi:hypothetical protein, partial [Aeromonas jandaei]|uniref:hypothetical protein n=1 Tax=Aeromonas jandaei TaxID=650 RepID=UPI001E578D25